MLASSLLALLTLLVELAAFHRLAPTCGPHITIHIRGKEERGYLAQGYDEYAKRLRPSLQLKTIWHKSDSEMEQALRREECPIVFMDENGKQLDSPTFSQFIFKKLENGGNRLIFVVGGAEGLPPSLKNWDRYEALSFSKMVLTHTWAWALLSEQIYRAVEIRKGSKYHKI